MEARDVEKIARWREFCELTRPFFREFGIATWALLLGVAIGVILAWWIYQVYFATITGFIALASVGLTFSLGVVSAFIGALLQRLLLFLAQGARRKA